jgi:hypothetical protein
MGAPKRGGWQWQMTQMTDTDRAARLWPALVLGMVWMVTIGTDLDAGPPAACPDLPDLCLLLGGSGWFAWAGCGCSSN